MSTDSTRPTEAPPRPLAHGLSRDEFDALIHELGEQRYRAAQVWRWLYVQRAAAWSAMTNLPAAFRERLDAALCIEPLRAVEVAGPEGATRKLLLELRDGERIETVLIPAGDGIGSPAEGAARLTVCVSSQVGCRFHCAFCASGQSGFTRNLDTGEIVGQVLAAAAAAGAAPTHVVFMGIGEPFDNYDAVLKAVRILNHADGLRIGARRITISTCGIIPGIERLAGENLQVELSVSLHAPDDTLRARLMPVARAHGLPDLMKTCRAYAAATGRIVTFEYTLIRGLNDSREQAAALVRLLAGTPCRVNLIPLSPVSEFDGAASPAAAVRAFAAALETAGINVTVRASKGAPMQAACGQLRSARAGRAQEAGTP